MHGYRHAVLKGLKNQGATRERPIASRLLAEAVGLEMRVVSGALNWWVVNYPGSGVHRKKYNNCKYLYWYEQNII